MAAPVIKYDCDWPILTSVEKSNKHHMITYLYYISALDRSNYTENFNSPWFDNTL